MRLYTVEIAYLFGDESPDVEQAPDIVRVAALSAADAASQAIDLLSHRIDEDEESSLEMKLTLNVTRGVDIDVVAAYGQ